MAFLAVMIGVDIVGYAIDNDEGVSYMSHLWGALMGIFGGILLLKNLRWDKHEKVLFWISLFLVFVFFGFGITWNLAHELRRG